GAGRALGVGAAHEDVLDLAALDAGALDRRLDGVAAQLGAVRHVEGTLPALAERRAGGGNDDGVGHFGTSWNPDQGMNGGGGLTRACRARARAGSGRAGR